MAAQISQRKPSSAGLGLSTGGDNEDDGNLTGETSRSGRYSASNGFPPYGSQNAGLAGRSQGLGRGSTSGAGASSSSAGSIPMYPTVGSQGQGSSGRHSNRQSISTGVSPEADRITYASPSTSSSFNKTSAAAPAPSTPSAFFGGSSPPRGTSSFLRQSNSLQQEQQQQLLDKTNSEHLNGHSKRSLISPLAASLSNLGSGGSASALNTTHRADPPSLHTSFADSPTAWIIYYFVANLSLTLFNKLLMNKFPFPWALTGIHALCGAVGAQIALSRGFFTRQRLTTNENLVLVAFSSLYTINIAVSNLSLNLVTVPFHQVVRAMTPLFTIVLARVFLQKQSSRATYLSLIPVVLGVVFATYGDYYFTTWGLILTLLGTLLAAMKTIVTNMILVGRLKLHPLDLLLRMSPLAFAQCVIASWYTGELKAVKTYTETQMDTHKFMSLFLNGAIAFFLNVVSFTANKKTSALTMTVAANVKQVLTIVLAVIIFNLHINSTNLFGITLTLLGGALYAKVEFDQRRNAPKPNASPLIGVTEDKREFIGEQERNGQGYR